MKSLAEEKIEIDCRKSLDKSEVIELKNKVSLDILRKEEQDKKKISPEIRNQKTLGKDKDTSINKDDPNDLIHSKHLPATDKDIHQRQAMDQKRNKAIYIVKQKEQKSKIM